MEILVIKWASPTETEARALERQVEGLLMGVSKHISPMFPGWIVCWATYRLQTTLRLVFHVEPEAELPQSPRA